MSSTFNILERLTSLSTALDLSTLPHDSPTTQYLIIVYSMVENGWLALLTGLSFVISTNLTELFIDVLSSYQALTNIAGMLTLSTPHNTLFNLLSKFAIPSRVVSSGESYVEPPMLRTSADNLRLTAPTQVPGLSE
ncbi:hypothetical protein DFJ58DRAFT_722655 [Suillus subalutaceus]|uniref:uncharacterized protein n=1 Tax=Suillus subalutaceus TaxID=48586 RepID=UPI001B861493|nr:uncharacterized protein DFJ58DRAFT_722655 [Suillus subalutaceus]KAG1871227.1 hypothetical protein DFJ58DRAFT_722655 [Suillus subalutaceus]